MILQSLTQTFFQAELVMYLLKRPSIAGVSEVEIAESLAVMLENGV